MTDKKDYSAEKITVLEGLEAVQRRPAMYIGSTGKSGLHHLVYEVIDNSVDEAMVGFCNKISVLLNKDGSVTVIDNGRGIPVDIHPVYKRPALEIVITKLHAGGKFDKGSYSVSGGLHGVGISVVAALSKHMKVIVKRNGKKYQQEYKKGKPMYDVKIAGSVDKDETGTEVTFLPDDAIFSTMQFDFSVLATRFREIAFLNKGLKITLEEETSNKKETFYYEGGVVEFVKWLNKSKEALHKPIYYLKEEGGVVVECSVQYNSGYQENVLGFVNTINTVEGGTHVIGFRTALTRAINDYANKNKLLKDGNLSGDDVREGLTVIISTKIPEPQFEGQTKTKLGNSEVKGIVDKISYMALSEFFEENPPIARRVVGKALEAQKARSAAKKAKELIRRKSAFGGGGLPGKLADCSDKKSENTELFIVEGDSAGGCFSGDTEIALADVRNINFKNLIAEHNEGKKHFCYTIKNDGSIGIEEITNPRITKRNVSVIKLVLDNNKEIVCTPGHKFMLKNGSYKEAQYLTKEDSLMPLYEYVVVKNKNTISTQETNYNHKIKEIIFLKENIDVYDIEVPKTHNFALASGVFVHNSGKQARNKEIQAILPLKGKILNVEKANQVKVLTNEEISALITAIGTGIGEQFDMNNLRYSKVILMADADVDGAHIRTLLLTFFFRFMPELIKQGHIYIAVSPLYRVRKRGDHYVYSDEELKEIKQKLGQNIDVQRFKGLGEMNPEQLWDTTMNPKTRLLKKVMIEDAALADEVFSKLMGDDVEARRQFIAERAKEAEVDV